MRTETRAVLPASRPATERSRWVVVLVAILVLTAIVALTLLTCLVPMRLGVRNLEKAEF